MIVAIAGGRADPLHYLIGAGLALLRRREGCRVLLVDAAHGIDQGLDLARGDYDDVVIDAGDCASRACRCALGAAQLALVPIAPHDADAASHYQLIAHLNAARMFNPDLRVLFVAADARDGELATVRAYAAEVMSGHVAATVIRRAALEDDTAPGLAALSREVFGAAHPRRHA